MSQASRGMACWNRLSSLATAEVKATLAALPPTLRAQADKVPVTLQRTPSGEMLADGIEADTLGLFVGDAYPDFESGYAPMPPQILLFLDNLWEFSDRDEEIFREEVHATLLHELGHYLGLDETDLEARGLE